MSTALPPDLLDEHFLRWVAEHATPEERANYGPLLKELAEQNARLSLQPKHQLSLDTHLPTPTGWTIMGDVHVGDQVFDERGHPCKVEFVSANREWSSESGEDVADDAGADGGVARGNVQHPLHPQACETPKRPPRRGDVSRLVAQQGVHPRSR